MQNTSSNFLSPYRAVGYVTDGSPLHLRRLGSTTFITSTVDNAFQIFNADHLRLALVSPPLIKGGKVVAIGMTKKYTLIATESLIQVYNRVTFVKIMQSNSGVSSLNSVVEDGMESETESENDNENIKEVTSQSEEEEMRSGKKRRRYNPNVRNQNVNKTTLDDKKNENTKEKEWHTEEAKTPTPTYKSYQMKVTNPSNYPSKTFR